MMVKIAVEMTDQEARHFSQLIKRLARTSLSRLDLVQGHEEAAAEAVLYRLQSRLAEAGYEPR